MSDTTISDSTPHNVADLGMLCRRLEHELNAANERIKRLEDCIETAWGIIANVSGGDWTRQKPHWQEAVVRWRDNDFHPIMKELSERKAKEAKP